MEKHTYTTEQIGWLLQVCEGKAQQIMREIKETSDTLRIKGVVHKQDYEAWLASRLGKK